MTILHPQSTHSFAERTTNLGYAPRVASVVFVILLLSYGGSVLANSAQ
ncbi:MAG: hypothetical protein ACI9DS_000885, partial [Glaciecola sp.]